MGFLMQEWMKLNLAGHFRNMRQQHVQREKPKDWLLTWVLGGRGEMHYQGRNHVFTGPELFILPPVKPHEYRADPNNPWEVIWVHFQGKSAPWFIQRIMPGRQWRRPFELDDLVLQRWDELVIASEDSRRRDGVLPHALLVGLLGLLIDRLQPHDDTPPPRGLPFDADRIQLFIHQHLTEPITLHDLARHAGLSPSYFSRSFRQAFKVSPSQYMIRQRVGRAATLLKETSMKLDAISHAVGYDDSYYLSRVFKKVTGISPALYRQRS